MNGQSQFTPARSETNILKLQPNSTWNKLRRDVWSHQNTPPQARCGSLRGLLICSAELTVYLLSRKVKAFSQSQSEERVVLSCVQVWDVSGRWQCAGWRRRRRRRSWNGVTEHPSVSTLLIVPTPSHWHLPPGHQTGYTTDRTTNTSFLVSQPWI